MTRRLTIVHDVDDKGCLRTLQKAADLSVGQYRLVKADALASTRPPSGLLVLCGKGVAETVLNRKVKITKEVGSVQEQDGFVAVLQYSPEYIHKIASFKGGKWEKAKTTWVDVWHQISVRASGGETQPPEVVPLADPSSIVRLLRWLANKYDGPLAYDYETYGVPDARRPELCTEFKIAAIGVAFVRDGQVVPVSFMFDRGGACSDEVTSAWIAVINRGGWAHYARYEHRCNLRRFGVTGPLECTLLMQRTVDELAAGSLERVMARCGIYWPPFKDDAIRLNAMGCDGDELLRYVGLDAAAALMVGQVMARDMAKSDFLPAVSRMESIFSRSLAKCEMDGMYVDHEEVLVQRARLRKVRDRAMQELLQYPEVVAVQRWANEGGVKAHAGKDPVFNPSSTPMMRRLILDELKIETVEKTEKGGIKLDKRVLADLVGDYPVLATLNRYRSAASMEVFLSKWDSFIGSTGCVHTQYHQDVVVTGRLSSTDPPLQNIPKHDPVRRVFVSRFTDGLLINADYAQQEPRLLAGWSGDPKLIEALASGLDLHRYVAGEIFGVSYEEVTERQREVGKRMNLGILYGQTYIGLARKTGMSSREAKDLIKKYKDRFTRVTQWQRGHHADAESLGFVMDLFGARRHLPEAASEDWKVRARALRQAGNYPIQSTAYRFTQLAVVAVQRLYESAGLASVVAGQVHDSIVVDSPPEEVNLATDLLVTGMLAHNEAGYWRSRGVPMVVEVKRGPNLHDMSLVRTC